MDRVGSPLHIFLVSAEGEFYVPSDDILRELGRIQVLHSHLDHTLRLAIKRLLGISINDPATGTRLAAWLRRYGSVPAS
jgi:hypothetical protein